MKFASTFISLAALFSVTSAYIVRYNTIYDDPSTSLDDVACSNGDTGLITKGYDTFGELPSFPGIGGVFAVGGWDSPKCGSCWKLYYSGTGKYIFVTAIDTISEGFDISLKAMNILTDGKAVKLDSIDVTAEEVPEKFCWL
ncbi:Cerato-platanin [Lactarius quietus]|nr:Cerato-platanin [Lactarius quietus]